MLKKEQEALELIKEVLVKSTKPIVLCSFGKDSMVLLYLIRKLKKDIPVLFFKEPFFPKKFSFANQIIEDWNLTMYDFPPLSTDFIVNNGAFEIANWYTGYKSALLYLPTGTHKHKNEKEFLCSVNDLLNRPTSTGYTFPWDTIFVGHKSSDSDVLLGTIQLKSNLVHVREMLLALPLANWIDKDIWKYTIDNNIPYNTKRYDKSKAFKEFEDSTFNNDYYPCCFKCVDNKESLKVLCPKIGKEIYNVAPIDYKGTDKVKKIFELANYVKES